MFTRYLVICVLCWTVLHGAAADNSPAAPDRLSAALSRNSPAVLKAFASVAETARESVVSLESDDKARALATVITDGLVITKASEMPDGKLMARLSDGSRVEAKVLVRDEDNDVALVSVSAHHLTPVHWEDAPVKLGQFAVTPGIHSTPEAVGIVSASARRILPKRAIIGVLPDYRASTARIRQVTPGLGADQAGIKAGDIIMAVNDLPVEDGEALVKTLGNFREGQTVKLRVSRDSDELELSVIMKLPLPEREGRGFDRQQRMNRLGGELSRRAEGFQSAIQHDSVLQPWQCGGPLLDIDGNAIGLNIARAGRIASYALPAELVIHIIDNLKKESQLPVSEKGSEIR